MPKQQRQKKDYDYNFQKYARNAKKTYYAQEIKIDVPMEVVLPPKGPKSSRFNHQSGKIAFGSPKSNRKNVSCPDASVRSVGLSDMATSPGDKGSICRTCTVAFSNENSLRSHYSEQTALPSDGCKDPVSKAPIYHIDHGSQHTGALSKEVAVSAETPSVPYMLGDAGLSDISIGESPTMRVIAETYRACRRGGVQLRVMRRRVVCVEYAVRRARRPPQTLRVYFSLRPQGGEGSDADETEASFKQAFESLARTHSTQMHNELEIIDGKLAENQPYLQDLKRIIQQQRKQKGREGKCKIDVLDLYHLARRQRTVDDTSVLNSRQLQEMKAMILQKCVSNIQGLARRRLERPSSASQSDCSLIPRQVLDEMLDNKTS